MALMHPPLKAEIFALLEAKILAGKKATGRIGMDLWQILVLGVVRLGLDADWDRLEDLANHHTLIRQMLGVPATPWGQDAKVFGHQTLRDSNARVDLLEQFVIEQGDVAAGREVFAKKDGAPLAALEVTAVRLLRTKQCRGPDHQGDATNGFFTWPSRATQTRERG
jgi:hypothetical protein